jgi:hypothetical protein
MGHNNRVFWFRLPPYRIMSGFIRSLSPLKQPSGPFTIQCEKRGRIPQHFFDFFDFFL